MTNVLTQPRPIRLKGRSFLALALSPELPFEDWLARLDDLAARSAGFFLRRPVVLDVDGLDIDRSELRELVGQLGTRNVRIMGIEGARPSLLGADLPPAMTDGRPASDFEASGCRRGSNRAACRGEASSAGLRDAAAGQGDALDHRDRAGALGPVALLPGRRRDHRRFGRVGRGDRRRRLDPRLRHAQGTGDGRHDRQTPRRAFSAASSRRS